ncbi:hypothetical protein ACN47E_003380 [Coniothyrium glycines]
MRNVTSCSFCRDRKKRCSFAPSHTSCRECSSRGLDCSLKKQGSDVVKGIASRHRSLISQPQQLSKSPSQPKEDDGLPYHVLDDEELRNELVTLYFELMHDKQHLIFHPATFMAELKAGKSPKFLVWGMAALISRFSNHASLSSIPRRQRGPLWLNHAADAYHSRPDAISVAALQGAILLAFAYFVEGDGPREQLLSAQAIRMVQVMRIPRTNGTDPVLYETQVRLYWQCWMSDTWHCARDSFPRHILEDSRIAKPMAEKQFSQLGSHLSPVTIRDGMPGIGANRDGIWTAMLPLNKIHSEVMSLNYTLLDAIFNPVEELCRVRQLANKVEEWYEALPVRLQFNQTNIAYHMQEDLGREFNVLHILYHFQSQMLYYRFLQDIPEDSTQSLNTSERALYASRCKAHAQAMSEIMWSGTIQPGMECFWSPVNGHLIVVASSVLLHTLMFDPDDQKTHQARQLLEHNFTMLLQLQEYWPSLENSMSRLKVFHKLCLSYTNSQQAFNMDRWMVRWLNKYDQPMEDKDSEAEESVDLLSLVNMKVHEVMELR